MLRKAVVDLFLKHLDIKNFQSYREEFDIIDTDGNGFIDKKELKKFI